MEPAASTGFCAACWSTIRFLDGPLCTRCGIPFDVPVADAECAACLAHPPAFDRARAILRFDEISRAAAEAAARCLRRAGAVQVQILAQARVVRAAEMPI